MLEFMTSLSIPAFIFILLLCKEDNLKGGQLQSKHKLTAV